MLRLRASAALLTLLLLGSMACGREAAVVTSAPAASSAAVAQDLLEAQAAGLVEVKFIPNDSRSAQVVVRNRSGRPLTLRLPEGFAGVPVLAQFMNQQQGGAGFGAGGIGGTPQNVGGGGVNNAGMGIGQPVGGGGPFSLPPERTRTLRVPTVCLEYGKREPSPRVEYTMTPLSECSTDPRLQDVVTALADGKLSQKAAQAAAWHVASSRTWEQLAAEVIEMAGGDPDRPYFAAGDLAAARAFVAASADRHPPEPASSESAAR